MIDPIRKCWRMDVLREVFLPINVERICNIPLSSRLPNDEMYWSGSSDGVYRVSDAYKLAIKENFASSSRGHDFIWKRIWQLNVPPKVKLSFGEQAGIFYHITKISL